MGVGGVEVFVKQKVRRPHEYVLAGSNKERVTYDELTMGQGMAGFCRAMIEETDQNFKTAMLDHLISLLDDCTYFSWSSAKERLKIDKIDSVRHAPTEAHLQ